MLQELAAYYTDNPLPCWNSLDIMNFMHFSLVKTKQIFDSECCFKY